VLQVYELLQQTAARCAVLLSSLAAVSEDQVQPQQPDSLCQVQQVLLEGSCEVTLALVQAGWSCLDLDTLPVGVGLPVREALHRVRAHPPAGWPIQAYALIGREDVAATLAASGSSPVAGQGASPVVPVQQVLPAAAAGTRALDHLGYPGGSSSLRHQLSTPATPVHQPVPWMNRTPSSGVVSIGSQGFTPAGPALPNKAAGSGSSLEQGRPPQKGSASATADAHDW
jgi:anaphase-promoting complex subunit 1